MSFLRNSLFKPFRRNHHHATLSHQEQGWTKITAITRALGLTATLGIASGWCLPTLSALAPWSEIPQVIASSHAEDLRIVSKPLLPHNSLATKQMSEPSSAPAQSVLGNSAAQVRTTNLSYQILISWSIPEPELAKIFAYAYQYQLPLLLQGFNARGQEASIHDNQLRVANLIAKYQLRGIPQVYIDERPFKHLTQQQVPVLVQVAQTTPVVDLNNLQSLQGGKNQFSVLYQQYGNVSLEALAVECRVCIRRAAIYNQLQSQLYTSSPSKFSNSSPLFPQPDITQVGTVVNPHPEIRHQEGLPREHGNSDTPSSRSSSSSQSLSSFTSLEAELQVLLEQMTPARVLGAVYPIAEQAFSELARTRLASAQAAGKLNFTQVRQQTPLTFIEQTRALKTSTLVRLRNRLENNLFDVTTRSATLASRLEQLHAQGATSYQVWGRNYPLTHLEQQLDTLQTQQQSLQHALRELEYGHYPLLQAQQLQQIDFRPERSWQIPHELLSAAQNTPVPLLHSLLIFVDLTNPQLQALLKDYFVEWHWLVSQHDAVVIVTDINPFATQGEDVTPQDLRSAFNYWLGSGPQVFLFNESLSSTFTPTAFTTVQQATTHDLTNTNLTMPSVLRGKLLVRDWSLADVEQWLRYIRQQRDDQLRSY